MDFLVRKFSEWLRNSEIPHNLIEIKGGYLVNFIDPDEDLKKLISSLFITIDTGKEENHMAIRQPVNIFTSGGDGIIVDSRYYADILNTCYPALRDYVNKKVNRRLDTH